MDRAKFVAAKRAIDYVEPGMRLGLGTGSTASWMIKLLGDRVREEGLKVTAVATSYRTADLAHSQGIVVSSLDQVKWLDLTIDGADEYDRELNLIKGGGGALLQEKIVATASDMMVVISDISKRVDRLGAFPLPVEVVKYGWATTRQLIEECLMGMDVLGASVSLRMDQNGPFLTDEGHYILDLHLKTIGNPRELSLVLNQIPGVVENGLFIDVADVVITGYGDGAVELLDINNGTVEKDYYDFDRGDNLFTEIQG